MMRNIQVLALLVVNSLPFVRAGAQGVAPIPAQAPSAPATVAPATAAAATPTPQQVAPSAAERAPRSATRKMTAQEEAGQPRADTSATAGKARKTADRVDLDTTTVTGNRELPKVMYVVPWKKSDIGDLGGKPMNSLLDEVLAPVDRDVFRREVVYYQAVKSESTHDGAGGAASPQQAQTPQQGEK